MAPKDMDALDAWAAKGLDLRALAARWLDRDALAIPAGTLPLAVAPFDGLEIAETIATLLEGRLTMGSRVRAFERAWADQVGTTHCIMVNSGSSALLVMLSALVATGRLEPGADVIVPAVGWSTSLFAVAQAGLTPVIQDVGEDSLCLEGAHDRPVLAVHLLGCPSRATGPLIIEDACGAHGARIGGRAVGNIGIAAAFSFFFSHHLTTGEGGAVTTSDTELADACRSIRAHGWVRERSDRVAVQAAHADIDPRFLFVVPGYNLRPTELAGAFGIHQVPRLGGYVATRRANHRQWCAAVADLGLPLRVFPELPGTTHAGFAFPMLLDADAPLDRTTLCRRLEAKGIQTRPISGSNLTRQPAFSQLPRARIEGPLPVADAVHERGIFVGQSHAFGPEQLELLLDGLKAALLE
ncbi:MAG: DegT/DnrJ/EryC1/StrS family aminotransferase [Oligoflexia bacterium]|nr:DegT/DnrJ/EryC1/StrS family aminotransferase [Oligoflexia bacterium]